MTPPAGRRPARGASSAGLSNGPFWGGLNEGDRVVVDSAPLIYLLEDHPTWARPFAGLFEAEARGALRIAVSTVTVAEVLVGPLRHRQDALAKRYERALESFDVVPVSAEIAVTAARLRAGSGLRLPDAIQAATALEIGAAALVTHDRDFSKLAGLTILTGDARR